MKLKKITFLTVLLMISMNTFSQKDYSHIPCFKLHFTMIKNDNIQKVVAFKDILLKNDTLTIERTINEMIQSVELCKETGVNPFYKFMQEDFKEKDINFEKERLSMKETLVDETKIYPYHTKKYYERNPDDLLNLYFYYQNGLDDQNNWFLKPEYRFSWGLCEAFKQYFDIEFFDSTDDYAPTVRSVPQDTTDEG